MLKVISGGQTGVDQSALVAASYFGFATGGLMPKGFATEKGPNPELAKRFGLTESESPHYDHRTRENVRVADAIIVIDGNPPPALSPGSKLVFQAARMAAGVGPRVNLVKLTPAVWGYMNPDDRPSQFPCWTADHEPTAMAFVVKSQLYGMAKSDFVLMVGGNRESSCPGIGHASGRWLREFFGELKRLGLK